MYKVEIVEAGRDRVWGEHSFKTQEEAKAFVSQYNSPNNLSRDPPLYARLLEKNMREPGTGRIYQVSLGIGFGFVGAQHVDELEYSEDELQGLTEPEIDEMVNRDAEMWANNYITIAADRII